MGGKLKLRQICTNGRDVSYIGDYDNQSDRTTLYTNYPMYDNEGNIKFWSTKTIGAIAVDDEVYSDEACTTEVGVVFSVASSQIVVKVGLVDKYIVKLSDNKYPDFVATTKAVIDAVGDVKIASGVSYDNATSGLSATTVQGALDEVGANLGELDERVTDLEQGGGGGSVELIESITYANLVTKRNNSQLTKGKRYRITDYKTIIDYEGAQTITDGQFDLIVLALSANTLSEKANAIWHDVDTYFADSALNSWKIGYVLDNSKDRQPLCDEDNGKGCIYFMEDENGNNCAYDFKSIKWKREIEGEEKYYFTFSLVDDDNIKDYSLGKSVYCYGNKLHSDYIECYEGDIYMNYDNVFINTSDDSYCHSNTFGDGCDSNTFGNYCYSNTFGYECYENTFGDGCYSNTFGDGCYSNTFGNECHSNTFGYECYENTFGDGCRYNTFGNECHSNTFGYECSSNTFGNECHSNTFGDGCDSNTFGNGCYSNTFGYECCENTFGNGCHSNTFGDGCDSNTFGNGCDSNTFGDGCYSNTFGDGCYSNTFGNDNLYNKLEDFIENINKSSETRIERNTRRWYYDANGELQFEILCYRSI